MIYSPEQWYSVVSSLRSKPQSYVVNEMDISDFSISRLASSQNNMETDDDGEKIKWMKIRLISISKDEPDALMIKYEYGGLACRLDLTQRLRKSRRSDAKRNILFS